MVDTKILRRDEPLIVAVTPGRLMTNVLPVINFCRQHPRTSGAVGVVVFVATRALQAAPRPDSSLFGRAISQAALPAVAALAAIALVAFTHQSLTGSQPAPHRPATNGSEPSTSPYDPRDHNEVFYP